MLDGEFVKGLINHEIWGDFLSLLEGIIWVPIPLNNVSMSYLKLLQVKAGQVKFFCSAHYHKQCLKEVYGSTKTVVPDWAYTLLKDLKETLKCMNTSKKPQMRLLRNPQSGTLVSSTNYVVENRPFCLKEVDVLLRQNCQFSILLSSQSSCVYCTVKHFNNSSISSSEKAKTAILFLFWMWRYNYNDTH